MPAYKDNRQGTWYASFYFENWQGVKQKNGQEINLNLLK